MRNAIIASLAGVAEPACRQAGGRRTMYTVYILSNKEKTFHYVGMTNNLERRLQEHYAGYSKTTKRYLPLELLYKEEYIDRISARKGEKYFKSGVGREYIKSLNL